jgi:hypothetical protein
MEKTNEKDVAIADTGHTIAEESRPIASSIDEAAQPTANSQQPTATA